MSPLDQMSPQETVSASTGSFKDGTQVIATPDGGYFIVWENSPLDGRTDTLLGRKYDANGNAVGGEIVVSDVNKQMQPDMTLLANGNIALVWKDGNDVLGRPGDFKLQILDQDGGKVGGLVTVNDDAFASFGYMPSVDSLPDGGFVVTWQGDVTGRAQQGLATERDIFLQRFDESGSKVGGEVQVNDDAKKLTHVQDVFGFADGGYVVTFGDTSKSGKDIPLLGQFFNADGTKDGAAKVLIETASFGWEHSNSEIAAYGDGFIVAYMIDPDGKSTPRNNDIRVQVFDRDGNASGDPIKVTDSDSGYQGDPQILVLDGGGFAVAWKDRPEDANLSDIYIRFFDEDGRPESEEIRIHEGTDGDQADPTLAQLEDGSIVVTFNSWLADDSRDGAVEEVTFSVSSEGVVTEEPAEPVNLKGTSADDVLSGTDGDDAIRGRGGDDALSGGAGDDRLKGNGGHDEMSGGEGDDRLKGGKGDDTIEGGDGNDRAFGGKGHDVIDGGAGNDRIKGGSGDDTITGGAGDDTLKGGKGEDTFVFRSTEDEGADIIKGFDADDDSIRIDTGSDNADPGITVTDTDRGALIEYDGGSILVRNTSAETIEAELFL
ncbi:calcium-binding protein [Jannaschia aquimarina]|uniref:ApxIA_1 protein n=1 Tax=Jannaschia aquimarina TaxID=935700 RepID=A0A0D1EP26_9RHOB|nr:calcium-binding protein [Jannaschia aquimarina]KIT17395.1 RTX-I toxin determinant A from serotypes 1/9 [Jannaschia aquimarina]SNT24517.1 Hemolysin-type calcium-binding repeat-containing protein [Jannaschia aquimarina]